MAVERAIALTPFVDVIDRLCWRGIAPAQWVVIKVPGRCPSESRSIINLQTVAGLTPLRVIIKISYFFQFN